MKVIVRNGQKVQVGGVGYTIRLDDGKRLRSDGNCGQARFAELEILVAPDLAPDRKAQTLLHECLHVVKAEYGCADGEDGVDATASGLLQILKQLGIEFVFEEGK